MSDFARFGAQKKILIPIFLALLALAAFAEFSVLGLARRTFVFYDIDSGIATVEERMLRAFKEGASVSEMLVSSPGEVDITRYVEEALLGPISPNSLPLFPKETRLLSLLYRDGVVYADFSQEAALIPIEGAIAQGEGVFANMETLYSGVKRNFPLVREIRFFIAGEAAYAGKFR
ncbi:MAG: GerMN domain-containing protein [Treponema sp.]|jgi:hypothetical protein|nr:GerMN domain-containing protein [Treponema sp.]